MSCHLNTIVFKYFALKQALICQLPRENKTFTLPQMLQRWKAENCFPKRAYLQSEKLEYTG
jgi:hypothetical protein